LEYWTESTDYTDVLQCVNNLIIVQMCTKRSNALGHLMLQVDLYRIDIRLMVKLQISNFYIQIIVTNHKNHCNIIVYVILCILCRLRSAVIRQPQCSSIPEGCSCNWSLWHRLVNFNHVTTANSKTMLTIWLYLNTIWITIHTIEQWTFGTALVRFSSCACIRPLQVPVLLLTI